MGQLYILCIFKYSWTTKVKVDGRNAVVFRSIFIKVVTEFVNSQGVQAMSKNSSSVISKFQGLKMLLASFLEISKYRNMGILQH